MWATVAQHLCQLRSILLFHFPCSFSNVEINSICQAVTSFVIPLCIWLFLFHRNPVISRLSEGNGCADTENSIAWPLPCFVFVTTSHIQAVWDKLLLADCGHWNSGQGLCGVCSLKLGLIPCVQAGCQLWAVMSCSSTAIREEEQCSHFWEFLLYQVLMWLAGGGVEGMSLHWWSWQ